MSFLMYDIILLVVFVVLLGIFLYRKRKHVHKEGLLLLHRTSWGIKLIEKVGKKYTKTLKALSYVSVGIGYILMAGMLYLVYSILNLYLFHPEVVTQIKVPPIMPLIPYIDKVVPFLPPFYFTYWIIIIALIAIPHEFAHGIFAALERVRIKKTGFGFFPFFLPVFLAAFVELDEKKMVKKENFKQRAILSAGTFANIITAAVFLVVLFIFFSLAFHPAGVIFNDYTYTQVSLSAITMINGVAVVNPNYDSVEKLMKDADFNEIEAGGRNFVGVKGVSSDLSQILLYDDAPAIKNKLNGAITEINGDDVKNLDDLSRELSKYKPGDSIEIKTEVQGEEKIYDITLGESPYREGYPWLGVGFLDRTSSGLMGKFLSILSSFKDTSVYYGSKIGEFGWFLYNLLWWTVIISFSVALVNMLPMGIFDGGRFFYLTILAITKSEKIAINTYKYLTWFFLLLLLLIMIFWAGAVF